MMITSYINQYSSYVSDTNAALINKSAATDVPTQQTTQQPKESNEPKVANNFLQNAQEALVYQRLGIDKDKIAEIKALIEELSEQLQKQGADSDSINKKMDELQKMLEQEYKNGRERMDTQPEREKGSIISALA
jgi:thiamine kinase-like enzyme